MSARPTPTPARHHGPIWVPNALSLLRLALGLAFPLLPAVARLPVLIVGALSDAADGAASRLLDARSAVGRLLDPIADKVFALGVLLTLLLDDTLSPVEVFLVALRDVTVGVGGAGLLLWGCLSGLRHLQPTWLGKSTTVAQFLFLLIVLAAPDSILRLPLLFLTAGLGAVAALDYLRLYLLRSRRPGVR
jgi:phosphatidylglycerophosphate synthase